MAFEIVHPNSYNATEDLRTHQYCFVRLDSSGGISLPRAGGDAIGVLQDKPNVGSPGAVCRVGDQTKVVAAGVIPAGSYVEATATGRATTTTTGAASLGQAITAATAAGDIITILFQPSAV